MDMKTYLNSLSEDQVKAYAERAGTNLSYLNNQLKYGYREPKKLESVLSLLGASEGKLTLRELCPSLMAGKQGKKNERILLKSLSTTPHKRGEVA